MLLTLFVLLAAPANAETPELSLPIESINKTRFSQGEQVMNWSQVKVELRSDPYASALVRKSAVRKGAGIGFGALSVASIASGASIFASIDPVDVDCSASNDAIGDYQVEGSCSSGTTIGSRATGAASIGAGVLLGGTSALLIARSFGLRSEAVQAYNVQVSASRQEAGIKIAARF
ncbi:MAG: hypothetical protein ACI8S6_005412 [Myxococcota bacterium]|jgi:hypothetical protein